MSYLDNRQSAELNYDGAEPYDENAVRDALEASHDVSWERTPLVQDPNDPSHFSYTSPAPPVLRIKLERGMKGTYGWEISVEGTDVGMVQDRIYAVNQWLRESYGEQP